ncbi:MAG: hypothetical protein ABR498_04075, partial [Candidatus Dormibacteria bacterium]
MKTPSGRRVVRTAVLVFAVSTAGTMLSARADAAASGPHPAQLQTQPFSRLPAVGAATRTTPGGDVFGPAALPPSPGSDPIDNGPQVNDPAAGSVTTVVGGSADGSSALRSTFFQPNDAVAAPDGTLYIADTYDNEVRAVNPSTQVVRTVAGTGDAGMSGDGGPGTAATLNFPTSV